MNLGRHHTLLLRLVLCMALCLPGAASAEQVLRRGNGPDVESLDPHRVEGVAAADVMRDLFEGLVSTGLDAEPIPGVAERWEISEDGLHYRFYLRHDARWSNGDAVTAMDFVVALRRSVDPATGSNYSKILSPIRNADEIRLKDGSGRRAYPWRRHFHRGYLPAAVQAWIAEFGAAQP